MNPSDDGMPSTRGFNFYTSDPNLRFLCRHWLAPDDFERAEPALVDLGGCAGNELDQLAAEADRNPPTLMAYDPRGARVDHVVRHPSYRAMEQLAFARWGLAAMSHRPGILGWPTPVPHVVKYALSYLFAQAEFGLLCPVSVTDSTSRMLRLYGSDELKQRFLPKLTSTDFESLWQGTQWMTERSGGSDVGTSTTKARQEPDGSWTLWGDKWFCSNANADVALTLARPSGAVEGTRGLAMFLVPKYLPDGRKNAWTINRLKDKLGSRSMATGEVTYAGAVAYVVGDLERGFHQMMEMVNVSRLSNAMRAAGIMRRCVVEAVTHARGRKAFGKPLAELPLLRSALLEMLLDSEAAISVVLHAAAVLDRWDSSAAASDRALFRILTPLAKYWTTHRARWVAGESMNVRGGNGYIEEWPNARLLRDAHLGAIWEGSTNVVALDVQRAILRDRGFEALSETIDTRLSAVRSSSAHALIAEIRTRLADLGKVVVGWDSMAAGDRELEARPIADLAYHLLATSLLLAEGEVLESAGGGMRKHTAARLYAHRWLSRSSPAQPNFVAEHLAELDALYDW